MSINVSIKPVKISIKHLYYPESFQVFSYLKVFVPNQAWVCWVPTISFCLIIDIQLQPFSKCLLPLHLPQPFGPPVIKRPPPGATCIPWSPISKAGPFLWADAEVEALRGRSIERRYQGSVRWRSHEGHGSLGGWAMSRGAWRAEAGLSHRPSVLQSASQSVMQCWSKKLQSGRLLHTNSTLLLAF